MADESDMSEFDRREAGYERVEIPSGMIEYPYAESNLVGMTGATGATGGASNTVAAVLNGPDAKLWAYVVLEVCMALNTTC